MNKVQTKKSLFQEINDRYHIQLKLLKKRKFCLKVKLILTIILPIFILALTIKVAKTFIRIKIRKLFTKPFYNSILAEPVKPAPVHKEIKQPEPISKDN